MGGKRVLVVEDSMDVVRELKATLESDDVEIIVAGNGQEGLDILKIDDRLDMCISDINMPIMNGFEMLERYKEEHPNTELPIFMLTTEFDRESKKRGKALGVSGWAVKPFNRDSFKDCVMAVLMDQ